MEDELALVEAALGSGLIRGPEIEVAKPGDLQEWVRRRHSLRSCRGAVLVATHRRGGSHWFGLLLGIRLRGRSPCGEGLFHLGDPTFEPIDLVDQLPN